MIWKNSNTKYYINVLFNLLNIKFFLTFIILIVTYNE